MFHNVPQSQEINFQGQKLTLQTGLLARQATASVLAKMGETTVLAAVVIGKKSHADYFPLQVVYEERLYAAGKIKGSRWIKREGRPSDNAVLSGRMVDRSLRSLFDPYIRNEIQVIITILSIDEVNSPDTLAVLAASTAIGMCGIEGMEMQVSGIRVGRENGEFIVNPSYQQQEKSDLDLVVSGDGENIMMLETGAKILDETVISAGLAHANEALKVLTQFQKYFISKVKKDSVQLISVAPKQDFLDYWKSFRQELEKVMYVGPIKLSHDQAFNSYKQSHFDTLKNLEILKNHEGIRTVGDLARLIEENNTNNFTVNGNEITIEKNQALKQLALIQEFHDLPTLASPLEYGLYEAITTIVRENILEKGERVDGRKLDETRKIIPQIDVLPHNHGSSLFDRGETQVLNVLTIGTNRDAQTLDDMEDFEEQTKRYIHHYNFPQYSVGEIGRYFGPGRREIGHGALAEKALEPVLPNEDEFPYTMRLVSECLGSNGSTSMASTCGSSLSLMAGGVPIKAAVAGVAMGLMIDSKSGDYKILTDIQGFEDHHGDMDFKVTGTREGITAIQLDNKVSGITLEVLSDALVKAKTARLHILDIMDEVIKTSRTEISPHAPRVATVDVEYEKIGDVIGPAGKVVKSIIAKTGVEIEIDDITGKTVIYGKTQAQVEEAKAIVEGIIREYKEGEIVEVEIYRLEVFGAFAKIINSEKDGLIHISEASETGERIKQIEDVFKIGQKVEVKVIDINDRGQIRFTRKGFGDQSPKKSDDKSTGGFEILA
jgi:polyribonucleotide nucleotidyltransferase